MSRFIFALCFPLIATVAANGGGYNYPKPAASSGFRPSGAYTNNVATAIAPPTSQYLPPTSQYLPPTPQQSPSSQYLPPRPAIVTKTIYIHSAPEEFEEIAVADQPLEPQPSRKNYNIVFIKAPTHNVRVNVNSVKQAQASNEEKTVIYVLAKKPDITKIQNQVVAEQIEAQPQKPEVYFIKYRTQEEALRAQKEIQAQYDALGGSTRVSDEGFAPISSVIGSAPAPATSFEGSDSNFLGSASSLQQGYGSGAPNPGYLPPQRRIKK